MPTCPWCREPLPVLGPFRGLASRIAVAAPPSAPLDVPAPGSAVPGAAKPSDGSAAAVATLAAAPAVAVVPAVAATPTVAAAPAVPGEALAALPSPSPPASVPETTRSPAPAPSPAPPQNAAPVETCPHCARPLVDARGARLRPIDLDFERILGDADASSARWLRRGAVVSCVLAVLAQVPVLGVVPSLLLAIAQLFWGRFLMARPYARHFAPVRRLTTRWTARLAVVLVVLPGLASAMVPLAGVVLAPAVFTAANWAVRGYFRFHFLREHRRDGILPAEKLLLAVLAAVCVLVLVIVAGIAALVL